MRIKTNISLQILIFSLFLSACGTQKHAGVVKNEVAKTDTVYAYSQPIIIDTVRPISPTPNSENLEFISPKTHYSTAFDELKAMLEDEQTPNFKRAVFVVENAYFENRLDYDFFCHIVSVLTTFARKWTEVNPLKNYPFADSTNTKLNASIFYTVTDTLFDTQRNILNFPYVYDFNDCFAREDWTNQFVTKLLISHKGNCHSLPFLYKILAEELGVKSWLSFTPSHIYIRNWCKKTGWYNTEMTNASFPNEGWLMASGFVSVNSIVSGIYMDTLGLKQSIVVCVNDLAKGYLRKVENPDLYFVLQCCDLGLKHYPNYAELLMLKAETHLKLFKQYEKNYGLNVQNENHPQSKIVKYHIREYEKSYVSLLEYDYREIPEEMFVEWVQNLENNSEKYQNKEINRIFKPEK